MEKTIQPGRGLQTLLESELYEGCSFQEATEPRYQLPQDPSGQFKAVKLDFSEQLQTQDLNLPSDIWFVCLKHVCFKYFI